MSADLEYKLNLPGVWIKSRWTFSAVHVLMVIPVAEAGAIAVRPGTGARRLTMRWATDPKSGHSPGGRPVCGRHAQDSGGLTCT